MNTLLITLLLTTVSLTIYAQDRVITEEQLPKEIRSYLKSHFPNNTILQASIDKGFLSESYDIILKDNIKLEFDSNSKVKEINSKSELPESVIPKKILKYVKTNYPNNVITEWELDDGNQQVELDNGLDLEFTVKGKFLRIDD